MDLITLAEELGLDFEIRVRDHSPKSEEATPHCGHDGSASPAEVFGCSLAACVAMMVHDYCDRHGHVDEDVAVALSLRLAHQPKRVAAITVDVHVPCRPQESEPVEVDKSFKAN